MPLLTPLPARQLVVMFCWQLPPGPPPAGTHLNPPPSRKSKLTLPPVARTVPLCDRYGSPLMIHPPMHCQSVMVAVVCAETANVVPTGSFPEMVPDTSIQPPEVQFVRAV